MKLIDADKLAKIYMAKGKDKLRLSTVINELEMSPKIDPASLVKRGRWERVGVIIMCSECGTGWNLVPTYAHYCPNCGALMED